MHPDMCSLIDMIVLSPSAADEDTLGEPACSTVRPDEVLRHRAVDDQAERRGVASGERLDCRALLVVHGQVEEVTVE